jgi:hypothetical protein
VLLALAEAFDVDLKSFAPKAAKARAPDQLAEIFADPMSPGAAVPRYELVEVADNRARRRRRSLASLRGPVELRRRPATAGEPTT